MLCHVRNGRKIEALCVRLTGRGFLHAVGPCIVTLRLQMPSQKSFLGPKQKIENLDSLEVELS